MAILVENRKARFDFDIQKDFEAGIELQGWEVKSIKSGHMSLNGAYVREKLGDLYLVGSSVKAWKNAFANTIQEIGRDRKLLMRKKEISQLSAFANQPGFTLVPLQIYTNYRGLIKMKLGIGKGKRKFDKRQKLKEKDMKRRIDNDLKHSYG